MSMYNVGSYSNNNYYNTQKDLELEKKKELETAEQQAEQESSSLVDEIENEIATLTPEEIENKLNEQKAIYLNSLNNYFFVLSDKSKVQVKETMVKIIEQALAEKAEEEEEEKVAETTEETVVAEQTKEEETEPVVLTSIGDIISYLNGADVSLVNTIKKEIGDFSNIEKIEISQTGEIKVISGNVEIVSDSSGFCTVNDITNDFEMPEDNIFINDTTPTVDTTVPETDTDTTTESSTTDKTVDSTTESTTTETPEEETEETTSSTTTTTDSEKTETQKPTITPKSYFIR